MIYVRVEEWPDGDREKAKLLGVCILETDTPPDSATADYRATLSKFGKDYPLEKADVYRATDVKEFPRSTFGPWDLVYRALRYIVGRRNSAKAKQSSLMHLENSDGKEEKDPQGTDV